MWGRLTCNKCRVRVEEGNFAKHGIISTLDHLSPVSNDEQKLLKKFDCLDCGLSCQAQVQDDVLIFVPEESRGQKQIIRKTVTERVIDINPAIRQVYVQVDHAELSEHRGDWGRLQDALAAQWNLHELSIDLRVLRQVQPALRETRTKWGLTMQSSINLPIN